jgi:hypothetical protein
MPILLKVKWVDKSNSDDPYQRITHIGGREGRFEWKHTQAEAIQSIEKVVFHYYIEKDARVLKLVVGLSPDSNKYLKTEVDEGHPVFLLNLPEGQASKGLSHLQRMKTLMLLFILIGAIVGCSPPKAPVMKRVPNYEQIDKHYLKNVFVPAYSGPSSKLELSNSLSQLEGHLAEFRDFMRQVEVGKIQVAENMQGGWQSYLKKDDCWIFVGYSGRLGTAVDFQKHKNQYPFSLVYGLQIATNGHLKWATTIEDGFRFDEGGKVQGYWHK